MKGIDSTGAPLVHVPGWMEVKAVLRIAYSNKNSYYWILETFACGLLKIPFYMDR
jgi:hypothetical protein